MKNSILRFLWLRRVNLILSVILTLLAIRSIFVHEWFFLLLNAFLAGGNLWAMIHNQPDSRVGPSDGMDSNE